jgi:hypothetical protein
MLLPKAYTTHTPSANRYAAYLAVIVCSPAIRRYWHSHGHPRDLSEVTKFGSLFTSDLAEPLTHPTSSLAERIEERLSRGVSPVRGLSAYAAARSVSSSNSPPPREQTAARSAGRQLALSPSDSSMSSCSRSSAVGDGKPDCPATLTL